MRESVLKKVKAFHCKVVSLMTMCGRILNEQEKENQWDRNKLFSIH